jgi:hypothetical protein
MLKLGAQQLIEERGGAPFVLDGVTGELMQAFSGELEPEGYDVGVEPRGIILRTFMNDVAIEETRGDAATFSDGAIIAKENRMPCDVVNRGCWRRQPRRSGGAGRLGRRS